MTPADARSLRPGDRIRLCPAPGQSPPRRNTFTVLRVEIDHGEVDIVSTDGYRFVPWEVERVECERER